MTLLRKLLNRPVLTYRKHRWRFHPKRWANLDHIPIDRPVFILGVQGGGLTLLARMLRRHPRAVSVTGDNGYWAGPDEMQNVMGSFLPQQLTGLHHKVPPYPKYEDRDSIYAIESLLPLYREAQQDTSADIRWRFKQAIRLAVHINTQNPMQARFIDKSQTYTVRLGLIRALLRDHHPHFILVWRNPYALCYRSATRARSLVASSKSIEMRLALAAQHWANSFACALRDAAEADNLLELRFEDLLRDPQLCLEEICEFIDLDFRDYMLPQERDEFPLGSTGSSRGDHKWYPLRPDVNRRYLDALQSWMVSVLEGRVAQLADRQDYTPDGP